MTALPLDRLDATATLAAAERALAMGRLGEAEARCRRLLASGGDSAAAHHLLGLARLLADDPGAALAEIGRAIALAPDISRYQSDLSLALMELGCAGEAAAAAGRALALEPHSAPAHNNLARALIELGDSDRAIAHLRSALARDGALAAAHCNLGRALADQGDLDGAVTALEAALRLDPHLAEAHYNLASVRESQGRLADAVRGYHRAIEIRPTLVAAYSNLAVLLQDHGRVEEAIEILMLAERIDPHHAVAGSNRLMCEQYRSRVTAPRLKELHQGWDRRHGAGGFGLRAVAATSREPERRLRLGFVSADLGRHPVGYFVAALFAHLDREAAEVVCYSDRRRKDAMTERLAGAATLWRDTAGIGDGALARQIGADGIDILIDLAGHTAGNRLCCFAGRAAPLQASWAGYVGTTGLAAMDYLIADRFHVPPGREGVYVERVIRLPDGYICYTPPEEAPEVAPLPALDVGQVTFGCFNNLAKIQPPVVARWAQILRQLPTSRLLLKTKALDDPSTVRHYQELFAVDGIVPDRIVCEGFSPPAELLATYGRIDIALDPFPYSGGLTTCEALWMGVPVVTAPGETFAGRHSFSHLSNLGLAESIAAEGADYVATALRLAQDLEALARLRAGLRARMAASPLCDGRRFAAGFLDALRTAWRRHCRGEEPAAIG